MIGDVEGTSLRWNIRIYHECEGRIEKSVSRIAVRHNEACRVMTNGDPEIWIFFYPRVKSQISFSCVQEYGWILVQTYDP